MTMTKVPSLVVIPAIHAIRVVMAKETEMARAMAMVKAMVMAKETEMARAMAMVKAMVMAKETEGGRKSK